MRRGESFGSWLDERLGTRAVARALFARRLPRGLGWIYTLGSVSLLLFLMQAASGFLLATSYVPAPDQAFDSVRYISEEVKLGSFVRGLHVWGASAMVLAVSLHMLRTFLTGAYKYPRELTWVGGLFLLALVLAFGFTGYLLPWNQKAYWATQVGTQIAELVPFAGAALARLLRGGDELGAQTLTRFYAIHVLLLPALAGGLIAVHLFMVVKQGISAPPRRGDPTPWGGDPPAARHVARARYQALKEEGQPFYPHVLVKDAIAALVVLGILYFLAWRFPPEIGEIADPTDASFNPRPEWYFLWLFQLLKYFPGRLEVVGAIVLPAIAALALIALPFADRSRRRHPLDRRYASAAGLAGVLAITGLTVAGARSPLVSAYVPPPPAVAAGSRIFRELHCDSCHSIGGRGGMVGPDLALDAPARDAPWMRAHFQSPTSVVPGSPMPAFGLLDDEIDAVIAYLDEVRGGGPPSDRAPRLYRRYCSECHALAGRGGDKGPNLDGIGSARTRSFIHRYIEDPKSLLTHSRMPVMLAPEGPLSHAQIEDIARYLATLREPSAAPRPAQEDSDEGS